MSINRLNIAPGDIVDVPWGFDTFPATVLEVYESGGAQRVRVRLRRSSDSDPEEAVLRVSDLAASSPESRYTQAGAWQYAREYERDFSEAVRMLLSRQSIDRVIVTHPDVDHLGDMADLVAHVNGKIILFELKWQLHEVKHAVAQASRFAASLEEQSNQGTSIIISSPNSPRAILSMPPEGPIKLAPNVTFVRWSGSEDDERLGRALTDILDSSAAQK